jgi:hypothetical protein
MKENKKKLMVISLLILSISLQLFAKDWKWPERAKNLKVLPKRTTAKDLRKTMLGFCNALNVGCESCHVGKANAPLSEFDFVSDAKPEKQKARIMMKMVNKMNSKYMSKIKSDSATIQITCNTCHKGNLKPIIK